MRLCAVSVDLDEVPNYYAIHGIEPEGASLTTVYDVAVDRLLRFAEDVGIPLTFFAIGSDLVREEAAAKLSVAHSRGHEIANHTLDHRYDFSRLGKDEIKRQIEAGAQAIADAVGERPVGFRAPGYTVTDEVFEVLRETDVVYDSSVFPCPGYWAAKTAAIGLYATRGERSHSIVDTPNVLRAPTRPYFIGRPYWKRGEGLLELPIQVAGRFRLPFIGTTLTVAGPFGARKMAQMCEGEPLINLELHGIDVLDESDGLEALRSRQADVRIAKELKLESLRAVVNELTSAGYSFTTLKDAAKQLS